MIKNYNPNINFGIHIIRVTFMQWDYVGHIAFKIHGNCKGAEQLNADFLEYDSQVEIDNYVENDCSFAYDDDCEIYSAILSDSDGNTLEIEDDGDEFKKMIVSIEIDDFIKE